MNGLSMRDPYDVLGVARDADADAIKQAYRRLAKQLHPDLNPGDVKIETRFKEVSVAYDLLSDPKKRARFDRGEIDASGMERAGARGYRAYSDRAAKAAGFGGFDAEDIMEMFTRNTKKQQAKKRGADLSYSISIDFIAAATGTKRRLSLPDGRSLDIAIPPGTEDGTVLRLKGQGQSGPAGGPTGDALVEVQLEPHPFFVRKGADIHVEVPVTLQEAGLGATITVPTIEGKVAVKVPAGSNSGTVLRLKGRGIPATAGAAAGDQYATLTIVLPPRIDTDLTHFLEKWGPGHNYSVRGRLGVDD
jgi:DnaJ-class molecular chaperone